MSASWKEKPEAWELRALVVELVVEFAPFVVVLSAAAIGANVAAVEECVALELRLDASLQTTEA